MRRIAKTGGAIALVIGSGFGPGHFAVSGAEAQTAAPAASVETLLPQGSVLSPDDMRRAAVQAVRARQPAVALRISDALLQRDPDDVAALIIRSRALRDLGRADEAYELARRAWDLADEDSLKYNAALVAAQALSTEGRRTRAQLWLRRATQHAPSERHRQAAVRDFRLVRSINPLQLQLGFHVAPNSNVNNGSIHDSSPLFGWPVEFDLFGTARALSGVEYGAQVAGRYRLVDTPTRRDDLNFQLAHTGYTLSSEAREIAPDAEGSDFATTTAMLGYSHSAPLAALRGPYRVDASLGQTWYGGDPLLRFYRLGVQQTVPLTPATAGTVSLSHEWQQGFGGRDDARHATLGASVDHRLESGHRLTVGLGYTDARADAAGLAFHQTRLHARLTLARPVMNMALDFGLSAAAKEYPVSVHSADGRQERTVTADVTATFLGIEYYGFSPSLTASYSRTDANVKLYDRENFGIQLGIRSAF